MKDFDSFVLDSEYWFHFKMAIFNTDAIKRFSKYVQYYMSEDNPFRCEISRAQPIEATEVAAIAVPLIEETNVIEKLSTSKKRKNVMEQEVSKDALRRSTRISSSSFSFKNGSASSNTTKRRTASCKSRLKLVNADKELGDIRSVKYDENPPNLLNWFFPSSKKLKSYHDLANWNLGLTNKELIRNIQLNIAILQAKKKEPFETLISKLVNQDSRKEIEYVSNTFIAEYNMEEEEETNEEEEDEEEEEENVWEVDLNEEIWVDHDEKKGNEVENGNKDNAYDKERLNESFMDEEEEDNVGEIDLNDEEENYEVEDINDDKDNACIRSFVNPSKNDEEVLLLFNSSLLMSFVLFIRLGKRGGEGRR